MRCSISWNAREHSSAWMAKSIRSKRPQALNLPPAGQPWKAQPRFAVRGLMPWPDFLNCITVFNREDFRAYLEAMVRMRFNTLGIHVYSGKEQWTESYLTFEYGGVGTWRPRTRRATNRWGYLPERTSRYGMGRRNCTTARFSVPRPRRARATPGRATNSRNNWGKLSGMRSNWEFKRASALSPIRFRMRSFARRRPRHVRA